MHPLDQKIPVTMTMIFTVNHQWDYWDLFFLLPVIKIDFVPPKRRKKNIKLPHVKPAGSIISMACGGFFRGVYRGGRQFKNSLRIDISLVDKNLSLKVSKNKIQMTGAKSIKHGDEACRYLFQQLREAKEEYLRSGYIASSTDLYSDEMETKFNQWQMNLAAETIPDFFEITDRNVCMVNYNYHLGFKVDRFALHSRALQWDGFFSQYENPVNHNINIKIPYQCEKTSRRKSLPPSHCFIINESGMVMQTGPSIEMMKGAYDQFWDKIDLVRDEIQLNPA